MIEQLIALLFIFIFFLHLKKNLLQLLPGDAVAFPARWDMESFQKVLGLPWGGCARKTSKLEAPRRHPVQMPKPPQMAPFDTEERWLHSELPLNVRAHHSIFEAEPSHPTEPFGSASPWWTQYCWRHSKPPVHITLPKCMELVLLHLPHRSPPSPDRHC